MRLFYTFLIRLYAWMASLVSLWNKKAKLWKNGRKKWEQNLAQKIPDHRKIIWFHCASLGEFDQGLPVMEQIKKQQPLAFLVVSFFSPSGFEYRKNHPIADATCYLPIDTPKNARRFIHIIHPDYAVFVKYEFWYNYLNELYTKHIPIIFISSNFRSSQPFFQWYGGWFLKHLQHITAFFVQNETSKKILESFQISQVTISGDTRFDRVAALAEQNTELPIIKSFKNDHLLLVAGSSWQPEEEILEQLMKQKWDRLKLIVAPHDISESHIQQIEKKFPDICLRYSIANEQNVIDKKVLIINNIGILNKIYKYSDIAFIGGGFGSGLHNILEAACYGVPVLFGPKSDKFPEALLLQKNGSGFEIDSYTTFLESFQKLYTDKNFLTETKRLSYNFIQTHKGATETIMRYLNRL